MAMAEIVAFMVICGMKMDSGDVGEDGVDFLKCGVKKMGSDAVEDDVGLLCV